MKQETKLLIEYLQKYFFDDMNNYEKYRKAGFKFYLEDNFLLIEYKKQEYKVAIIEQSKKYYWYISKYDNSYYNIISFDKNSNIAPILNFIINDYNLGEKK